MSDICKALNLELESIKHKCVTIEEREHMDATFMLFSLLQMFLDENKPVTSLGPSNVQEVQIPSLTSKIEPSTGHVFLILFQNNYMHLSHVALKLNLNLKSLKDHNQLTVIELFTEESSVKEIFRRIYSTVNMVKAENKMLIFNNVNHLLYLYSIEEVMNFARYVKNSFAQTTRVLHCTQNRQDNEIIKVNNECRHLSVLSIDVSNLKTGFCKEISGHINIFNKFTLFKKQYHFNFTNKSVNIFLPGSLSTR